MNPNSTTKNPEPPSTQSSGFVKLAMRNMVRKGNQSIIHFALTAFGFVLFIVAIAWVGRPNLPH